MTNVNMIDLTILAQCSISISPENVRRWSGVKWINLIHEGLFWGCLRKRGDKKTATHPTMMKLGTVISYLKKIQKIYKHVTHHLSSADISNFSPEISKFSNIKEYRFRLHFDA